MTREEIEVVVEGVSKLRALGAWEVSLGGCTAKFGAPPQAEERAQGERHEVAPALESEEAEPAERGHVSIPAKRYEELKEAEHRLKALF
jgi:hypothetical protein